MYTCCIDSVFIFLSLSFRPFFFSSLPLSFPFFPVLIFPSLCSFKFSFHSWTRITRKLCQWLCIIISKFKRHSLLLSRCPHCRWGNKSIVGCYVKIAHLFSWYFLLPLPQSALNPYYVIALGIFLGQDAEEVDVFLLAVSNCLNPWKGCSVRPGGRLGEGVPLRKY